jgi:aryl-alcohol dehydrogenase-like predicted oxidoreductase
MEYRPFGQTGIKVSAIGIGCWEIGGGYGSIEEREFTKAVNRALDLGVNCFDTAEAYGYGTSERSLAKALGQRRKEAIISTKFGAGYPDAPHPGSNRDSSRKRVMASIEKSLANLRTDYVDIFMVHWPDINTPIEETIQALDEIVKQGKARAAAVSNYRLSQLERAMKTRRIDVVQYGWNMFDRRARREIFPYCREHGIGVMAYGSLAYGILSGTFTEDMTFASDDWRSIRGRVGSNNLFQHLFTPDLFVKNVRAVEALKVLANRYGKSLPQLALRWTTTNPVISTALVGCRSEKEVDENVGSLGWAISNADMDEIDAVLAHHGVITEPEIWIED